MNRPARPGRFPLALDRLAGAGRPAATELLRPQRPLQHAAQHAAAQGQGAPQGLGLDSAAVRARMVARLRAEGIGCAPVLQAFALVERHRFVDSALANQAYEDTSLPIGLSQTISKPSVVARMLSLLMGAPAAQRRGHLGKVLEIGSGCGYQAAVLMALSTSVVSIERLLPLHERARRNLDALPLEQVRELRLLHGDGRLGHAPRAPYDAIVAAAGGEDLPEAWLTQLAVGGRLVAPMHDPAHGGQVLLVVDRRADGELHRAWHDPVHFVPLKSGLG
jgi:protein-L-isoaspartate(D-aspartate) O-methyltransferase